MLHEMIRCKKLFRETDGTKSSDIVVFGQTQPLSVQDALDLYQDVVFPLRMENNLQTKQRLMKVLIKPLDDGVDYDDDNALEGDDEFGNFFGYPKGPVVAGTTSSAAVTLNAVVKSEASNGSATKKPKLSRAFYVLEEAKTSVALAPEGTKRPYDKKERSISGSANCRECSTKIALDAPRVGIQVYKPEHSQFWPSFFHTNCFPEELLPQLRLDPNPSRKKPTATKKSWNGKKSYGGGYEKKDSSWGNGWKNGGYRNRR